MGLLESIGILAILAILFFLYINHLSSKNTKEQEIRKLAPFNKKCQEWNDAYYESKKKGDRTITSYDLLKGYKKILSDPKEREIALRGFERKRMIEKKIIEDQRRSRIIGYKYEELIFEIFGNKTYLHKDEIINAIQVNLNKSQEEAENIFSIWGENLLIRRNLKNNICEVGLLLSDDLFNLDKNDFTRSKWLKKNNIELVDNFDDYS